MLVVGEGKKTEPNYFIGLSGEDRVAERFTLDAKSGKGGSPLKTVNKCVELARRAADRGKEYEYDAIWCLLDVEQAGKNPQLGEARKLARKNDIRVALSNPAFEVWTLAHFKRTAKSFINCDKVIEELNKHWQKAFARQYEKNDEQIYDLLRDRTDDAIGNAKSVREEDFKNQGDLVDCNSATEVYQVVEILLGASK